MIDAGQNKKDQSLAQQNSRLKDQMEELKDMLRVSKESIDTLSKCRPAQRMNTTLPNDDHLDNGGFNQVIGLKEIIKKLSSKNQSILDQLYRLQRENQQLHCKMLILDQISDNYEDQQKKTMQMMQSQLKSLSRNLITTNDKLSDNEKHKFQVDNISGLAIKFKEVFNPTEQAMKFEKVQSTLREQMCILKMDIEKLKSDNRNLTKLNMILHNDLTKTKTAVLIRNHPLDKSVEESIKKLALYFLEAQRYILEGEDSDDQYEDLDIMAPELVNFFPEKVKEYKSRKGRKVQIPKIDLTKIRQLMKHNSKFVEADLKRRNKIPQTERLRMLQEELDFTRRELTRSMLLLKELETKHSDLKRVCTEQLNQNKLIKQSYNSINEKMVRKNKAHLVRPNYSKNASRNSPNFLVSHPNTQTRQSVNPNSPSQVTSKQEFVMRMHTLSEDVANLPHVMGYQPNSFRKLKRSSSNPSLQLDSIQEIEGGEKPIEECNLMGQTYFEGMREGRFQENLDDIQV